MLDSEFSFFDHSDAFAPDDLNEAVGLAQGNASLYRNRVQRNFARAMKALQTGDSGRSWQDFSKASPSARGSWSYPRLRWGDPHFAGAESCARCGQVYDAALAQLGSWDERIAGRDLIIAPGDIPWTQSGRAERVVSGRQASELSGLVAYGLVTGEIKDAEEFLDLVYRGVVQLTPDWTASEYARLGIPKSRLAKLRRSRH
jgi:hypothetical protein